MTHVEDDVNESVNNINLMTSYSLEISILKFGDRLELFSQSFELSLGVACYEFRYFLCQNTELSCLCAFGNACS